MFLFNFSCMFIKMNIVFYVHVHHMTSADDDGKLGRWTI